MKKRTNKYNPVIIKFDTSIKYKIPMIPNGKSRIFDNEVPDVIVNIEQKKDGYIHAFASGYQNKYFMDLYFDWLLYTGYVKRYDKE